MWTALSIFAAISLLVYWGGKNAVWGAAMVGAVGGLIAAAVYFFMGHGLQWAIVGKWAVVATLIGSALELFGRLTKKKESSN